MTHAKETQAQGVHADLPDQANRRMAEIQAHIRQTQILAVALGVLLYAALTTLVCAGWLLLLL